MVPVLLWTGVILCDCPSYPVYQHPYVTVDVTIIVSLCDCQLHCVFDSEVIVTLIV